MEKLPLEKFIKKYNLNGSVEAVRWAVNSTDKTLYVAAKSEDESAVVYVKMMNFDAIGSDVEFGVLETKRLRNLMNNFTDKFDISVNKKDDEVRSLDLSNDRTQVQFVASSLDVVSTAPEPKGMPTFAVEIDIDENFIEEFGRAKSSLPSADTFTLMNSKDGELKLILGYSNNNTDRVTLSVKARDGKKTLKSPLHFRADILKNILSSNDDTDQAVLKISERGLAHIEFSDDDYTSNYYMVATRLDN